jgi:lipopolysaccharide export system protein LptA
MKVRNPRSIIIIFAYVLMNLFIVFSALRNKAEDNQAKAQPGTLAPEFTEIEDLNYFHLKNGIPQMSLSAIKMHSLGEEVAEFVEPKGVYNYEQKDKTIKYQANAGTYRKEKELLILVGEVRILSDEAEYLAEKIKYFFKKDLILAEGGVTFKGLDLKTKDQIEIHSDLMEANPEMQFSRFSGKVHGSLQRKKKYEGRMTFESRELQIEGEKSLAHLEGEVMLKRQSYLITAGKADIFLENFNKSLKYFVFNDDVKVTETLQSPKGTTFRKAYAERLEGFGREQKMVLSGAPKVEHGEDVVKGYRITIRENMDLIEVDDAMSDMQMKRDEEKTKDKLKE